MADTYDVIIIGTGAGGGTLARHLAPSGKRILLLERGDTVSVVADGREIARGLAAYSSTDAAQIAGRRSGEIEALLGYRGREELIHRDDLVVLPRSTG